jgi:hypothetical protein
MRSRSVERGNGYATQTLHIKKFSVPLATLKCFNHSNFLWAAFNTIRARHGLSQEFLEFTRTVNQHVARRNR